jgi:hypothetical protein
MYDRIMISINNNNNNAIISYYYGKLQELVLIFKIPIAKRKAFFEIYGQFGMRPQ